MDKHRHVCGLRAMFAIEEPPRQVTGCGYVWDHVRANNSRSRAYREGHMCPNCNCGPWYALAGPDDGYLSPPIPRVAFGRIVRPALDNVAYVQPHELEEFYEYARSGDTPEERDLKQFLKAVLGDDLEKAGLVGAIVIDSENKTISGFAMDESHRLVRRR